MAILVTGGAGFIGSHFIELLLRADTGPDAEPIVCLDNFNAYYSPAAKRANVAALAGHRRVTVVEQDFTQARRMARLFARYDIRRVMHLGGYAGVRPSVARPRLYQRNNVGGTLALLEAARRHGVERFVLASSSTVYGLGAATPFVEDAPLGIPASPYGASKRAAELYGQTYWQLHGVPVVCVRPFSVYGPRLRPDLALAAFTAAIAAGRPLTLYGDGSVARDFTHVSDICQGLLAALRRPGVEGEAINLGHHAPVAMRDVIAGLERLLGRAAIVQRLPACDEDLPLTQADLTKARRLLGYEPQIAWDEGLRDYVQWFLGQQNVQRPGVPLAT